jgi:tetratricopeptide (TPR) repeat protein
VKATRLGAGLAGLILSHAPSKVSATEGIHMQIGKTKFWHFCFLISSLVCLLSGCVAFQVGGEIQKGRMELMYGDPKVALAHFQRAAELNPNYRLEYTIFPEGVWTYVGRANLASGMIPEARQALERARTRDEDDLAKLYLGLALARGGDFDRASKELEAGLRGIADWYDYIQFYHVDGQFWDPAKQIRKAIQKQLTALATRETKPDDLVQNLSLLGREIEIEIDRAKDHKDWYWQHLFHGDERRP